MNLKEQLETNFNKVEIINDVKTIINVRNEVVKSFKINNRYLWFMVDGGDFIKDLYFAVVDLSVDKNNYYCFFSFNQSVAKIKEWVENEKLQAQRWWN